MDMIDTRDVFLRPARVVGRYDDNEQYLDVQFRLLREDLIRPLREGIVDYRMGGLKKTDLFVYRDVSVLKPVMNKFTGDMLNSVQIPVRILSAKQNWALVTFRSASGCAGTSGSSSAVSCACRWTAFATTSCSPS